MSMDSQSGLTTEIVHTLLRKGWKESEISVAYGVTRQWVNKLKRAQPGYPVTERQKAMDYYPWHVGEKFNGSSLDQNCRDHLEYQFTGGKGMPKYKVERLMSFYERLVKYDLVVEFDPNIPPTPGNNRGGFAWRQREDSDGDLIIRVNEHTKPLSDVARKLWRLPNHVAR